MNLPRSTPPTGDDTFWGRLSPTARHGACIGLLLLVAVIFFAPVLFGGKGIGGTDVVNWRANAEVLKEYEARTGERALWAPNTFGGMPAFLMKYNLIVPQADTLVNAVRPVAWPASHFFVLLVGMYLLVFYLTRNHLSGLLSAVAFGFTTYIPIILAVGHATKFVALALAPYVVLAFVYTLRNPSLLGGLLFACALALDLRAKHPQITYYVLMLLLMWWVVELVVAWRENELAPFGKATGWLALGTGLALLMVAHPYLAIYQYKQFSVRGAEVAAGSGGGGGGGMGWEKAMQWSQGPTELITLVMAEAFGGGSGGTASYWGPKPFTEGPHYIGGVVAALSGLALWKVRDRVVWGIGAGVAATILFALGKYASFVNWPMFSFFPFFDAFRAPETWLSVSALGLSALGGVGLDYVLRQGDRRAENPTRPLLYAFGAVAGLVLLLLVGRSALFDFESQREAQVVRQIEQRPNLSRSNPRVRQFYQQLDRRKQQRQEEFRASAFRTLLALGAALLLLWLYRRGTIAAWLAGALVVLIVTIDLWGVDRRYLGDDQFSPQKDRAAQIPTYPVDRFLRKKQEEAGGPGHFRVLPLQHPSGQSPMNNALPSYHYQQIGGYHAAKLQRYQDYVDHILQLSGEGPPNENALDLMNTRYIVAQQQLPGTEVVYRSDQNKAMVLENPDAVPRGFLVGQVEVTGGPQETWRRLRSPSFEPDSLALLPKPLEGPIEPIDSSSTASVTLESYTPPEITWSVETDAPRLFVASEVYYPAGWKATLDGEETEIRRVDYLLRGVRVPAGEHTLTMRFEPAADRVGIWVAGSTTALVYGGILGLMGLRYRRREREKEESDEGGDGR